MPGIAASHSDDSSRQSIIKLFATLNIATVKTIAKMPPQNKAKLANSVLRASASNTVARHKHEIHQMTNDHRMHEHRSARNYFCIPRAPPHTPKPISEAQLGRNQFAALSHRQLNAALIGLLNKSSSPSTDTSPPTTTSPRPSSGPKPQKQFTEPSCDSTCKLQTVDTRNSRLTPSFHLNICWRSWRHRERIHPPFLYNHISITITI